MFCGHCGEENPETNRFCFECGARILRAKGPDSGAPVTDEVSARLAGLAGLPEPSLDFPDDHPAVVEGKDGAPLRLVPAGFFWMGERKEKKDERPYRLVYLDHYYIDEHPVTNAQYAAFVARTGSRRPPGFRPPRGVTDWDRWPVTRVTWGEATAYAQWAGKRLPTEAEWEKAARGIDGRRWPWGDADPHPVESELANFGDRVGRPTAVGSYPDGRSPLGCLDMAGNVWEWCEDQYDGRYYPRSVPRNPVCLDGDPRYRVMRGGAYGYSAFTMRTAYRGWNLPSMRAAPYGFRCAANAIRYRKRRKGS